jgi:hypothetical protein
MFGRMKQMPDVVPLTYEQRFIHQIVEWGLDQVLNISTSVRMRGAVNLPFLRQAAGHLLSCYPILGAALTVADNALLQQYREMPLTFDVIDLNGADDETISAVLSSRAADAFNFEEEPPLRISVAVCAPDELVLLLTSHHIFVDLAGLNIVLRQYLSIYSGLITGTCGKSPREEHDYFTYARSQQQEAGREAFARRLDYWQKLLNGADPVLHLAERHEDPAVASLGILPFRLDADESMALIARAEKVRVSSFTLFTSAILGALMEITGQDDVLLAYVVDTRRGAYRNTVGQFGDMLLLRDRYRPDRTTDESLRSLFTRTWKGQIKLIPSDYLRNNIDWLQRRSPSYGICESVVDFITVKTRLGELAPIAGHRITRFNLESRGVSAPFHGVVIKFIVWQGPEEITGVVQYETAIMSGQTAHQIRSAFLEALRPPGAGCLTSR